MLHSLTRTFDYLTKKISGVVGITINNTSIDLIKIKGAGKSARITIANRFELANSIFTDKEYHEESIDAFNQIGNLIGSSFSPIQIALPDPLFSIRQFPLENLPGSKKPQIAYVQWNFSKILNNENISCDSHVINSSSPCLLGIAVENLWISQLLDILKKSNIHPTVINPSSLYLLEGNLDINLRKHNKAIIVINDGYWTLIITDANNNIVYFNPQWSRDIATADIVLSCTNQIKSLTIENQSILPQEILVIDSKSADQAYALEIQQAIDEDVSIISLPESFKRTTCTQPFKLTLANLGPGILQ